MRGSSMRTKRASFATNAHAWRIWSVIRITGFQPVPARALRHGLKTRDTGLAAQLGLESNVRACERLRDGAVLLRALGELAELGLVDLRHLRLVAQRDRRNLEALADLLERDVGRRADARGLEAVLAQRGRERHAEAPRVRRRDELFGVRPGRV